MKEGAAYLRISDDDEGLALGVARQREDVLALAEKEGINLPEERILVENDVGASTRSKKKRPEYDKLKRWVDDGTVKYVLFYSNSRLTRRPAELEDWIVLHEKTGVKLLSKVSGNDDLGTADGRMVARIKASVDAAEAERIGERVKRTNEQRRAAGKPQYGGQRPFGFKRVSGMPELVPVEVDAIQHGATMLLAGATFGDVMREWESRGLKPVKAKAWTRESVRSVYRSPRIAGLVAYKGEIVGEGDFPAILDRATWEAVNEAVQHGTEKPAGYGARKHVLAGFVFCGSCGATMVVQEYQSLPPSRSSYVCVRHRQGCGGVRRNKPWLDAFMDGYVNRKLAEGQAVEVEGPVSTTAAELAQVEAQIEEVRQQHIDGQLDGEDFFPLLRGLRSKVTELRKREAEEAKTATQSAALHDPIEVWKSGTLVAKRAVLAGLVQGIYVKPLGKIGRRPIPDDSIEVVPA